MLPRDEWLTAKQVTERYPVSMAAVRKWMAAGISGVRLHSQLIGGRRMTRQEWIDAFFAGIEIVRTPLPSDQVPGTNAAKRRAQEAVERVRNSCRRPAA